MSCECTTEEILDDATDREILDELKSRLNVRSSAIQRAVRAERALDDFHKAMRQVLPSHLQWLNQGMNLQQFKRHVKSMVTPEERDEQVEEAYNAGLAQGLKILEMTK
jgi:hypothetical protein